MAVRKLALAGLGGRRPIAFSSSGCRSRVAWRVQARLMIKSHVIIRRTVVPSVVEIEVAQPRASALQIELERLLERHQARSLANYVVDTRDRVMLHAKVIRRDGAPIEEIDIVNLLEDLRGIIVGGVANRASAA
jgi:hypothetical protein